MTKCGNQEYTTGKQSGAVDAIGSAHTLSWMVVFYYDISTNIQILK